MVKQVLIMSQTNQLDFVCHLGKFSPEKSAAIRIYLKIKYSQ